MIKAGLKASGKEVPDHSPTKPYPLHTCIVFWVLRVTVAVVMGSLTGQGGKSPGPQQLVQVTEVARGTVGFSPYPSPSCCLLRGL